MLLQDWASSAKGRTASEWLSEHRDPVLVFLTPEGRTDQRVDAALKGIGGGEGPGAVPNQDLLAKTMLDGEPARTFRADPSSAVMVLDKTPILVGRLRENHIWIPGQRVSKF